MHHFIGFICTLLQIMYSLFQNDHQWRYNQKVIAVVIRQAENQHFVLKVVIEAGKIGTGKVSPEPTVPVLKVGATDISRGTYASTSQGCFGRKKSLSFSFL